MNKQDGTCPLTQQQLIDEYFMETRARILDVAAFLDRMDRSVEHNAADDFRIVAMRQALKALCAETSGRVYDIQMIFSDPTTEPLMELDRKSAFGAFDHSKREVQQ
ncbi:MAG: hypothetical protein JO215_10250 [Ktedonobacteraceae bacterium]|nr:hypothetical protein [Ktedonobacteraceae bacterium]